MRTSSLITNDHSARCYRGKDMKIAAALIRFYFCLCSLPIPFDQALRNLLLLASLPFGSPQSQGQILQLGARKTIVGDADLQDLSHCTGHIGWRIGERRANHVGVPPSSNAREGCWRSSGTHAARHPPSFLRPPLYSVGQGHVVREAPYVFQQGWRVLQDFQHHFVYVQTNRFEELLTDLLDHLLPKPPFDRFGHEPVG
jgi:hypothetical protein